ncbi:protein VAC14 homolog [Tasmannia lanceolata]|uniref:protein VAC14 homolog n=1 Tax=Tasmannia lanceolata TaxID=3420 RepID=UPI004062EF50
MLVLTAAKLYLVLTTEEPNLYGPDAPQADHDRKSKWLEEMMGYLNELDILAAIMDAETQIDIVLSSLCGSFKEFIMTDYMNKITMSLTKLMNQLQITEDLQKRNKKNAFLAEGNVLSAPKPKDTCATSQISNVLQGFRKIKRLTEGELTLQVGAEATVVVQALAAAGDHDKITAGGLIGLAAAMVGLTSGAAQHLEIIIFLSFPRHSLNNLFLLDVISQQIVPPVLNSFSDQDSRVRYYAYEALYNIAKVVRGDFIVFYHQIFDALCTLSADSDSNVQNTAHLLDRLVKDIVTESDQFSIEEFIPLLRERMNVLNPYVRQFLVGWITVLHSVPDIDMLGFLQDSLSGLFNMLSDSSHEIRQQADSAVSEFLQEIKDSPSVDYGRMAEILVQRAASSTELTLLTAITWINEFVKLGGDQLVPYYADILGAILPCISDKEEKIRVVARKTNEELRAIRADPAEGFDVGAILSIARKLSSEMEATRIEALHLIATLLARHRTEVISFLDDIFGTLLKALSDPSDEGLKCTKQGLICGLKGLICGLKLFKTGG